MAEVSKQGLRPDDGDTEWLVRQFGRFGRLLKAESSHGDGLPFLADPGTLLGARTLPSQEHSQTRRLLQLSNRQHQEHLCYMQKFSVAHERRLRSSVKGQRRKRARGCEQGAESSSSSSSEEDATDDRGAIKSSAVDGEATERSLKSKEGCGAAAPVVGIGGSTRTSKEEANPLLLAAYDLLTCTAGSVGSPSASLPKSLSEFLSSQDLRRQRQTGWGRESARHGDKGRFENSASARNAMEHSAASLGPEDEDWGSQEALDEAEVHPIRQLQERVVRLPTQNQSTKEHLMSEQLRLLALRWKCLLLSGWNILVAGCGSKDRLLREFASLALNDGFCCIMNAYQREFKLQQALQAVVQVVRNHLRSHSKYTAAASATTLAAQGAGGANASCIRLVKELKSLLRQCSHILYLVVLGLDSVALTDARRHLAALASCGKVRLICSADHLQHALLVDAAELRDFRFVFETAHTRRDYRDEVLSRWGSMCNFVPGWLWTGSRVHAAGPGTGGVNFAVVLRGLTTNHKRLLRSIAELQLAQLERNGVVFCFSGEPPVVSLADLGTETSGISLSLSKIKLKELLIEVTSHGAAVHARKNGQDAIAIRGNKVQLQGLLELLDKAGV